MQEMQETREDRPLPDDPITLAAAAALLPSRKSGGRIHPSTVLRWVASGKVDGWKVGGVWFVSRAEVLGQVRGQRRALRPGPRTQGQAKAGSQAAVAELLACGFL